MLSTPIHKMLKRIFSASFIGSAGFLASALCVAAAIVFSTAWAPVIDVEGEMVGGGHLMPLTTKLLFCYSAVVLFSCSVVTLDLFQSRRIVAKILGEHWKLTTVLIGTAAVCSAIYFLITFVATHVEPGEAVAGRPFYQYAYCFGYELILPQPKFSREDGLTALFLLMSGCVSGGMFFFISLRSDHHIRSTLPGELWGALGAGFSWLAIDEFFEVNRFISANAAKLGSVNFREEFSYIVLTGYALVALVILLAYVKELWNNRMGFFSLMIGIVFQAAASGVNFFYHAWRKEEAFEIGEAAMYFIAIIYYAYDELDSYIQHQRAVE